MTADARAAGQAMADATQREQRVTADRLIAFLEGQPELSGAALAVSLDTSRREAGASSGTCLFDLTIRREAGAEVTRSLVFRYDLGSAFFRQYALAPQFATLRALHRIGFCAPEPLWLDADGVVAGQPGLVMVRAQAQAPSITPFQNGPLMDVTPTQRREMILNAARVIARMNGVDVSSADWDHLKDRGRGDHYIDRELQWTLEELRNAVPPAQDLPAKSAFYREVRTVLEAVAGWLGRTAPRHRAPELAHGDANITNMMYRGTEVATLLDYELTHLGLGEADLAYQIAGIAHFRLLAPAVDGIPDESEMLAAYRQVRGKVEDWDYARVMGEWRLAVFAAMGLSRLPPQFDETERAYWSATRGRLSALLPDIVHPLEDMGHATP